ncbi:MAG TPA: hypothetical protein VK474_01880, partial [Chthoniobacterales bacterium]|nr:hypothetical protein [Chthoniobacterales bacterium]
MLFSFIALVAPAQESPSPAPTPMASVAPVHIRFVPPPLEGTISLGIYDSSGKLVRVLQREAEAEDFDLGSDALGTTWDGKDDRGQILPQGKYRARGYVVGDGVEVEGVGYFFNDWVTEENSAHLQQINNLRFISENELALLVAFAGGSEGSASCDLSGKLISSNDEGKADERFLPHRYSVRAEDGKLSFQKADGWKDVSWPDLFAPRDAAPGKDGSTWVIDRATADSEELALKEFSKDGAFLRQMLFPADEPQPKIISASTSADRIFLLEESPTLQRVRGLTLIATTPRTDASEKSLSDWQIDFENQIVKHKNFGIVDGQPVAVAEAIPPEKVSIKLQANPLQKGANENLEVAVGYDAAGSFLKTADGLPLQTLSETPHLTRIILAP